MRHGRSMANEAGIILSNPAEGIHGWGLVEGAEEEIRVSVERSDLPVDTLIYSSPFKRATETAWYTAGIIACPEPNIDEALMERYFGSFDKSGEHYYRDIWSEDAENSRNNLHGVESPTDVLNRLMKFLFEKESDFSDRTILLVSHGDPLNILFTHFSGLPVNKHRDIEPIGTAELRPLLS